MIEATVLLLTLTDQYHWGFAKKIHLNCRTDVDDAYYGSLTQVSSGVIRYDIFKGANIGGICSANREIIEIAQTYHPRYVLYPCNFTGIVTEATLIALRKMDCKVVVDFFDDDNLFECYCRWMIPCLDYVITHVPRLVEKYEDLGARCILTPAMPFNPAIHRKLHNQEKFYDATFVGQLYPYRRDYIANLAALGAEVSYLGAGNGGKMHSSQMVKIINQSRINLNFSSGIAEKYIILARVFEVPLCGGFLLTEYFPDLERWFEIGREIECFKTAQEAAEKIQYYLKHPDEREQIAACGYARVQRDYTGPVLLNQVFREIENDLCKSGRPEIILADSGVNTLRHDSAEQYYVWVRALLKSPPPLRDEWFETAKLVLLTNPEHKGAKRLLRRAKKWGDPEPLIGMIRVTAYRTVSVLSGCIARGKNLTSDKVHRITRFLRKV